MGEIRERLAAQRSIKGSSFRLLSETITSPTLARQLRELLKEFPEVEHLSISSRKFTSAHAVTGRGTRRGPGGWVLRALPASRDDDTAAKEWERLPG
jgi:hypothetical protein